jgi:hypothetical protein
MDTTQIFLLDTSYVRSLVKEVSTSYSFDYIPILVSLISAGAILYANRMTLKRVKGDTLYQSRLTAFLQWETNLREASANLVSTVRSGFYVWMAHEIKGNVATHQITLINQYAEQKGHNVRIEDLNKAIDTINEKNIQGSVPIEKINSSVARLKFLLDPTDAHYQKVVAPSQKLINLFEELKINNFEANDEYAKLMEVKQKEASKVSDELHLEVNAYIASKRKELEMMTE